eukprot:gene12393-3642_t
MWVSSVVCIDEGDFEIVMPSSNFLDLSKKDEEMEVLVGVQAKADPDYSKGLESLTK